VVLPVLIQIILGGEFLTMFKSQKSESKVTVGVICLGGFYKRSIFDQAMSHFVVSSLGFYDRSVNDGLAAFE
jgi:hypothetical protein